jgi:hypothetical protein
MQVEMDALAARIRQDISVSGFCHLGQADLAFIWADDHSLSNEEKCMHVKNFALRYGFVVAINFDTLAAVFLQFSK